MTIITECPSCGEQKFTKKISCEDHTVSHETFSILECTICTTLATTPRPNDGDLHRYYLSDDYISHSGKAKSVIDKLYLLARTYTLKRKLKLIERFNKSSRTMLDYGCGTGEFLKVCKTHGWDIDGVEPSTVAREKASNILSTEIRASMGSADKTYNIVTLWHVLEHVPDPADTLLKISERLSPTGTIIVAVPNYKSYDAQYYKQYWAAFDVPRHLWHFSPLGMKTLIQQHNLKLVAVKPMNLDSYYVSLLSEKYKRGKSNLLGMLVAFGVGLISNLTALLTKNHSSLIYVIKKK